MLFVHYDITLKSGIKRGETKLINLPHPTCSRDIDCLGEIIKIIVNRGNGNVAHIGVLSFEVLPEPAEDKKASEEFTRRLDAEIKIDTV